MAAAPPAMVRAAELPGRGRALVAARPIKEGEALLTDSPLLVYPASLSSLPSFCSHCFRSLLLIDQSLSSSSSSSDASTVGSALPCSNCHVAVFCSPRCLSLSHPHLLCLSLPHLLSANIRSMPPSEVVDQLLFLLSAYSLPSHSFLQLLSLSSPPPVQPPAAAELASSVHSLLTSLIPSHLLSALPAGFSADLTMLLLAKDKTNAFALMEPFRPDIPQGHRKARAYAIYPNASLFNHDCLPNACHFDYVDRPSADDSNTNIVVRALHDIDEGREVCLSYFAVNWSYADRQKRLLEDYGFRCECDRCKVESQWKQEEDDNVADGDGMDEEEEDQCDDGMEEGSVDGDDGENDDFPHAYFFAKYLCDRESCGGMLAPLPPSPDGTPSDLLECNVCGQLRKEGDIAQDWDDGVMLDD